MRLVEAHEVLSGVSEEGLILLGESGKDVLRNVL